MIHEHIAVAEVRGVIGGNAMLEKRSTFQAQLCANRRRLPDVI
jgi:hypothetical protein